MAVLSLGGLNRIEGISLLSADDDVAGIAVMGGTNIALSIVSPRGTFGGDSNYPLLTVVARIPVGVPMDTTFPVALDAGSVQLFDPAGVPYPVEVRPGKIVTGPSVTIENVVPGSATLPAGTLVSLFGSNFQRTTDVDLDDGPLAQVLWISPARMDVVLAETTVMHGAELEAKNRDSRVKYFSYQRTTRTGTSREAVLNSIVPLFRRHAMLTATLRLSGATTGVGVQNLGSSDAIVAADLFTASGAAVSSSTLVVPPNTFALRGVPEMFGVKGLRDAVVRLRSSTEVQVLGVVVDSAGAATPRLPL
jgi:hypothetical protein